MKIVLAGATGFLGRPLVARLIRDGHDVVILTRSDPRDASTSSLPSRAAAVRWNPDGGSGSWAAALEHAAAVVNLAGESIADRRWTAAQKTKILESRVLATRSLVTAMAQCKEPPRAMVSGSAVGYYGDGGDRSLTESDPAGSDFLADVTVAWEQEARKATARGTRVALVRTGVVLEKDGGALKKLLPPFKMFVGGPLGNGRQYWAWIHRADWVEMVAWLLTNDSAHGPFNATAPEPLTNAEFSRRVGEALGRPSWLAAPAPALRLALGEMADGMLLIGQRAVPAAALAGGFKFKYGNLREALRAILG